jgi:hypothetical protein
MGFGAVRILQSDLKVISQRAARGSPLSVVVFRATRLPRGRITEGTRMGVR